jgi:hypothetical protein
MLRTLVAVAALTASVFVAGWSDAALQRRLEVQAQDEELFYVPSGQFLQSVSLGYRRALADVLWFRTISYFGRHYRGDRVYPWLAYMCDVVTDLDPQAEHVYRFAGVVLPWEADRVDDGIALLQKGVRNLPDSWYLRYVLGFTHYFFNDDLAAASSVLKQAMSLPGAPEMISRLAALVHAAEYGNASAVQFLAELERGSENDALRGIIRERLRELRFSASLDELNAAVSEFVERFGRSPLAVFELQSSGVLPRLPDDPFGGHYVLDPFSGEVRSSSGREPVRLSSSRIREMFRQKRGKGV